MKMLHSDGAFINEELGLTVVKAYLKKINFGKLWSSRKHWLFLTVKDTPFFLNEGFLNLPVKELHIGIIAEIRNTNSDSNLKPYSPQELPSCWWPLQPPIVLCGAFWQEHCFLSKAPNPVSTEPVLIPHSPIKSSLYRGHRTQNKQYTCRILHKTSIILSTKISTILLKPTALSFSNSSSAFIAYWQNIAVHFFERHSERHRSS